MPRQVIILIIFSLIVSACGTTSVWGVQPTPTPDSNSQPTPLIDPLAGSSDPIIFPTSTTPPIFETQSAYTATPQSIIIQPTFTQQPISNSSPYLYYAQSGDMLSAIASRFSVNEADIISDADLTKTTLIDTGVLLVIPNQINEATTPNIQIMPDAEIVYSPTGIDFDIESYVKEQNGYLSAYRDYLGSLGWIDGYDAIQKLAIENSINPRLLLAILEFESRWVRGQPIDLLHTEFPMGFNDYRYKGLSVQLTWAINNMSIGYYGWRAGTLKYLEFADGTKLRIDPRLNAGTVAIQYLFSKLYSQSQWAQIINPESGFLAMYNEMFGDPWQRAKLVDPLFPPALNQPPLVLPFEVGVKWSFTGGPHNGWGQINPNIYGVSHSVYSAIDLAPAAAKSGCQITTTWTLASASGLVVRSDNGVVMIDLDGDGYEQTGWNLMYLHVASKDRVPVGTWVEVNDRIGHASCEGGITTGTHIHFARKYNGEWVTADGPIPFVLSGWRVVSGNEPYKGTLIRGDETITSDLQGQAWSNIIREEDE